MKTEDFESVVDYTTVLNNFSGPLDLLLFLINKEEIEIKDIFVSQVTEQFLQYMKGLPYLDVDKVSEYLNIAATIIKIKAQALVPNLRKIPRSMRKSKRTRRSSSAPSKNTALSRKRRKSSKSWRRSATTSKIPIRMWARRARCTRWSALPWTG